MISIIIPAFREAERIGATVAAVWRASQSLEEPVEILVVDDGSDDATAERALTSSPSHPLFRVLRLERNQGKGAALARGLAEARGELIVMLDADLGATAAEFPRLLAPVLAGEADMTIAVFGGVSCQSSVVPSPPHDSRLTTHATRGGFGLALRTARWGVARLTGRVLQAPLSGQRAFRAAHLPLLMPLAPGYGLEVGLDIDALRAGLRLVEMPTTMAHAATGRDWVGFRHRGRQLLHILRALIRRAGPRSPRSEENAIMVGAHNRGTQFARKQAPALLQGSAKGRKREKERRKKG